MSVIDSRGSRQCPYINPDGALLWAEPEFISGVAMEMAEVEYRAWLAETTLSLARMTVEEIWDAYMEALGIYDIADDKYESAKRDGESGSVMREMLQDNICLHNDATIIRIVLSGRINKHLLKE